MPLGGGTLLVHVVVLLLEYGIGMLMTLPEVAFGYRDSTDCAVAKLYSFVATLWK